MKRLRSATLMVAAVCFGMTVMVGPVTALDTPVTEPGPAIEFDVNDLEGHLSDGLTIDDVRWALTMFGWIDGDLVSIPESELQGTETNFALHPNVCKTIACPKTVELAIEIAKKVLGHAWCFAETGVIYWLDDCI